MPDAQDRGWGHPDTRGYRTKNIVKINAGGRDLWVRREVAHLFKGFIDEIVARGYRIDVGEIDDWGYNNRDIRNRPGVKSNHSWGLAVDLNSRTNPMGDRLVTDMPAWVPECAERWGLYWGGRYKSNPDAMHFEFLGTPADVSRYPTKKKDEELTLDATDRKYLDTQFAAIHKRVDDVEEILAGRNPKDSKVRSLIGRIGDAVKAKP